MKFSRASLLALSLAAFFLSGCPRSTHSPDPSHPSGPPFAKKIQLNGLSSAGKVNDFLCRGSQPNEEGIEQLKKLGVTTIVDLRGERQGTVATERNRAAAHSMEVVNIRASGWSPPKDEQLVQFFSLLQKRPKQTLYVHCWLGDDRSFCGISCFCSFSQTIATAQLSSFTSPVSRFLSSQSDFPFTGSRAILELS
jgi:hypothetical protein